MIEAYRGVACLEYTKWGQRFAGNCRYRARSKRQPPILPTCITQIDSSSSQWRRWMIISQHRTMEPNLLRMKSPYPDPDGTDDPYITALILVGGVGRCSIAHWVFTYNGSSKMAEKE